MVIVMTSTHDCIVFLGPTLELDKAQTIYPQAAFHEPIRCGDILKLLRLDPMPSQLVIIDGYYEFCPAVWHKEILWAIEQGVKVYGAASMGALRAAELHQFGMIGVGRIFNDFAQGILTDDDEVAVLHEPSESGYRPVNDAMVNIRSTLELAQQQQLIDDTLYQRLLAICKQSFYPRRSLKQAIKQLSHDYPQTCQSLLIWLDNHQVFDQKAEDAQAVLAYARSDASISEPQPGLTPITKYIQYLDIMTYGELPHSDYAWLPAIYKRLRQFKCDNPTNYQIINHYAFTVSMSYQASLIEATAIDTYQLLEHVNTFGLQDPRHLLSTFKQNDDLGHIFKWLTQQIIWMWLTPSNLQRFSQGLALFFGVDWHSCSAPMQHYLQQQTLMLLALEHYLRQQAIEIEQTRVQDKIASLLTDLTQKTDATSIQAWLDSFEVETKENLLSVLALLARVLLFYKPFAQVPGSYGQWRLDNKHWLYEAFALWQSLHSDEPVAECENLV